MVGLNVTIDSAGDPIEAARWFAAFQREYERLLAEAADLLDDGPGNVDAADEDASQADEMVRRWVNHNPANAEKLHAVVRGLHGFGYILAPSQPRSSTDSRTYLRVLRPGDRENAGNMNSESFGFVKTRMLVEGAPGVHGGRYPSIKWAQSGSVETVLDVANRFLRT